jgi:hypothetical protein
LHCLLEIYSPGRGVRKNDVTVLSGRVKNNEIKTRNILITLEFSLWMEILALCPL